MTTLSLSGSPSPAEPITTPLEESCAIAEIIREGQLSAVFQPIVDFGVRAFIGFEGLIRGPSGSVLHSPAALFAAAAEQHLTSALEAVCREVVISSFVRSGLPGKLFVNSSPNSLLEDFSAWGTLSDKLQEYGLAPSRVIIELTENERVADLPGIRRLLDDARAVGCQFAIDDLGEGFSNLRLWSEIQPEYIKIDRHFIDGIANDRLNLHFVRAMRDLAEVCSARLIAEGIEREEDLLAVRDLGLACGQGYFICRPEALPAPTPSTALLRSLDQGNVSIFPQSIIPGKPTTARSILRAIVPVSPETDNETVITRFENDTELESLPVVANGLPVGMIHRNAISDSFSRPFRREVFGRRACTLFMDTAPLVVDQHVAVQELGLILSRAARRYLHDGFIIVADGYYAGVGSGHDLMALITEMQISAARYANPLTQLPGNVPINEHIDRLLSAKKGFIAAYADLDNFKPFNDTFGYRLGDDIILTLARTLSEEADRNVDFVGHIGGDDFMLLMQSDDWQIRCQRILSRFDECLPRFFSAEDRERNGYFGESRRGEAQLQPLVSLSLGVVSILPGNFESHREVAAAAARAKKMAKRSNGSSLFIERRGLA